MEIKSEGTVHEVEMECEPVRRSERKRIAKHPGFVVKQFKKSNRNNSNSSTYVNENPQSKCVICYAVFDHSTAFSRTKKLSPTFCMSVFNVFSRFLDLKSHPGTSTSSESLDWDFETFPLPFCSSCTNSVLGWTKLQEQCEELQATLTKLRESVRENIMTSSQILSADDTYVGEEESSIETTAYNSNIEFIRRQVLSDINSNKSVGRKKGMLRVKNLESIQETGHLEPEFIIGDVFDLEQEQNYREDNFLDAIDTDDSSSNESWNVPKFEVEEIEDDEVDEVEEEQPIPVKRKQSSKKLKEEGISFSDKKNNTRKKSSMSSGTESKKKHPTVTTTDDGRNFYGETEFIEIVEGKNTRYKCGTCGAIQKTLLIFKRHVQQLHSKREPFECLHCGKILRNIGSKSRHMKIYHSSVPRPLLQCDLCGKRVTSQRGMVIHKGLIHREGLDKFHLCDICSRPFHNEREMKNHRWSHKSEEEKAAAISETKDPASIPTNHVCKQCGKILSSEANLKSHELIHSSEKPFVCDVCGWAFRHKANLLKHLEIHMDGDEVFRFPCKEPDCGKKFRSRTQLRNHSFSHKNASDKPHKCPNCDAFFVRAFDLTVHKRVHTQEKPFQCQLCAKYFSRQHHWSRHMKNVHHVENPGRPTKCEADTIVTYIEDFSYSLLAAEPGAAAPEVTTSILNSE